MVHEKDLCAGPEELEIISRDALEHLDHGTEMPVVLPVLFNAFISLGDDTSALSAKVNKN